MDKKQELKIKFYEGMIIGIVLGIGLFTICLLILKIEGVV